MTRTLIGCMLTLLLATAAFPQTDVRISAGVATTNLVERVDPVYPAIAKVARIQGAVVLEVDIATGGSVINTRVVSGPPMLITAATDAVKQWKYKPYLLNGEPVSVKTTVTVNFTLGIPDADYEKEQETAQVYYKQDKPCREAIAAGRFSEAQNLCSDEVKTAEQLPESREMERISAYSLLGQAYFYDKKFPEALTYFQRELASAQKRLHDDDAETAYAYRHVAWGLHANGRGDEALPYYEHAENSLHAAQAKIESDFLKNEYAKTLKATLRDHAILLRQMGKPNEADVLDKQSDAIVIGTSLKSPY